MKRKVCTPVDMLHHVKVTWNVWDHLLLHIIHEVHILHTPAGWKFLLINNFIYTCSHTKTFSCLFLFCYRVRKHLLHHVWPVVMLYWHDHFIIVQIHNVLISAMTVTFITIILVFCSTTSLVHISEEAIIDWDVLISPQLHLMPETWNTNSKWFIYSFIYRLNFQQRSVCTQTGVRWHIDNKGKITRLSVACMFDALD